jgi:hypothetical protein
MIGLAGSDGRRRVHDEQIDLDFGGIRSSLQGSSSAANRQNGGGGISSCTMSALLRVGLLRLRGSKRVKNLGFGVLFHGDWAPEAPTYRARGQTSGRYRSRIKICVGFEDKHQSCWDLTLIPFSVGETFVLALVESGGARRRGGQVRVELRAWEN